ncbi:MAG: DNA repair protein RecO, partial [Gammaproteobacteria bacterium HGW-Gammaproteobacteria-14]
PLFCGFYLNELLVRLLHREESLPSLFDAYEASLDLLSQTEQQADVVLRHFEFRLLDVLGYGVSLDCDSRGVALQSDHCYRLVPEEGLVEDARGNFPGRYLNDIATGCWHDKSRRAARDLMREALAPHLGGRPLESRKLFRHSGKT